MGFPPEAVVVFSSVGEHVYDLSPLGDFPVDSLDVLLQPLLALLHVVDVVVAVLPVFQVLP